MLLIIAVLAFLAAAFLLFRYSRRQINQISDKNFSLPEPPAGAGPLFAPTDAEMRREAETQRAREIAKREYHARSESRKLVDAALNVWLENKTRANAVDLLRVTAENGLDGDLARAADEILKVYRETGIDGLDDGDLAALLDSHLRLASQKEAGSGALFWLKQEVARLRVRQ